tara:strand:- start:8935 stop:9705 length:771 start_codon:yes stop_codon:yes gene_type:complete
MSTIRLKSTITILLISSALLSFCKKSESETNEGQSNNELIINEPNAEADATEGVELIHRADYEFKYNEKFELPYYVKYTINQIDVSGKGDREGSKWEADSLVTTGTAVDKDYVGSGYDRGHLKPAAASKTNQEHMNQSHLFSNCSPQAPSFNRGGWRVIESDVRGIVANKEQDSVIIYTGPVLNNITEFIGNENQIGIPKYHFKAVLYGDSSKAYAYLCPNKKLEKPYSNYIISIDSLESIINIDLYQGLHKSIEE